jgi:hypothetical protein
MNKYVALSKVNPVGAIHELPLRDEKTHLLFIFSNPCPTFISKMFGKGVIFGCF